MPPVNFAESKVDAVPQRRFFSFQNSKSNQLENESTKLKIRIVSISKSTTAESDSRREQRSTTLKTLKNFEEPQRTS